VDGRRQLERVAVFPDVVLVVRLDALFGHAGLVQRLPAGRVRLGVVVHPVVVVATVVDQRRHSLVNRARVCIPHDIPIWHRHRRPTPTASGP